MLLQVIGCEDHLRNDLYHVGWGVKLYTQSNPCYCTYLKTVSLNEVARRTMNDE